MKKSYFLNVILFALIGIVNINAQTSISGIILNDDNEELPGAHIYLSDTEFYTYSDSDGSFQINEIPIGKYNLVVSYIGFKNFETSVEIDNQKAFNLEIILTNENLLEEIIVNGRLEGQSKALSDQKNRVNISNIIAKEQIERFPDANLGDALKRVTGINVQYDQGEARFANIRGTSPELNSITIDGERVPSAEAEKRYVQLDLIPADMINTIEVNKAVTPDMDGDAIGGSINLKLKKARKKDISAKIGSGYSFLSEEPLYKAKLSYANRFLDNKFGLLVNASVLDKQVRSDNVEAEWDYTDETSKDNTAFTSDLQTRQYYLQRLRQSYSATLDYNLNARNNIYARFLYNKRDDWENRFRLRFKDIELVDGEYQAEIRRQTKGGISDNKYRRLEDQRMYTMSVGGEHNLSKFSFDWGLNTSKASEDRPNERYISMRAKDVPVALNLENLRTPVLNVTDNNFADLSQDYSLRELTEEFQYTEEEDLNIRLNIEYPLGSGTNPSFVKFGGKYKTKSKLRDNNFIEYSPINEDEFTNQALSNIYNQTNDNFSVGNYQIGSFVKEEFLGDINLSNGFESETVLEELAGNFEANEDVTALYAMYTQEFNNTLSIIAGARYEMTQVDYSGTIFDGESITQSASQTEDYSNVMPGVLLNYKWKEWTNIKLAWTNTIARPNYFDLVPYQQIDTEDNRIQVGNPALEATTSMNVDFMVEHFFKNIGILSAGVFYKKIENVIAERIENDFNYEGVIYDRFNQPINIGNADLLGFELGLQRRLDFLPGALKYLSFYANYTYNKSELTNITIEDREGEKLPLVGTPENLLNLSLAYDTKKMDFRLSYNAAGSFIEEYSDDAFYDRWYDKVQYLDFNWDYKVNKTWAIYLNLNNLLDQPLRYFQGTENRTMQVEYYGITSRVGLKVDLD